MTDNVRLLRTASEKRKEKPDAQAAPGVQACMEASTTSNDASVGHRRTGQRQGTPVEGEGRGELHAEQYEQGGEERDELVGVADWKTFHGLLREHAIAATATGRPLSLLMVDIDKFKVFDEDNGPQLDQRLLRLVATKIQDLVDSDRVVGRYKPDTFGVLLPGADWVHALDIAERVRGEFASHEVENEVAWRKYGLLPIFIGGATYREDESLAHFVHRAETTMACSRAGNKVPAASSSA